MEAAEVGDGVGVAVDSVEAVEVGVGVVVESVDGVEVGVGVGVGVESNVEVGVGVESNVRVGVGVGVGVEDDDCASVTVSETCCDQGAHFSLVHGAYRIVVGRTRVEFGMVVGRAGPGVPPTELLPFAGAAPDD